MFPDAFGDEDSSGLMPTLLLGEITQLEIIVSGTPITGNCGTHTVTHAQLYILYKCASVWSTSSAAARTI